MQPTKKKIYSNPNAYEVVSAFLEKYARATAIFAKINRLDFKKFVITLHNYYRYNQRRWYAVKSAIKMIQEDEHAFIDQETMRKYLTFVKENYPLIVMNTTKDDELGQLLLDIDEVFDIELIRKRG